MESAFKITTHGRAVLAAAAAREAPARITRVAFGDGRVPENTSLADVHELIHYVAGGTVGKRQHKDDRLFFDIQYENIKHPDINGIFYLSEFMVFITDPVTSEETDFLYGTLGDYIQVIPPYRSAYPASVWILPLAVILSDELEVYMDTPAGLVTYQDLYAAIDSLMTRHASTEILIPSSGWVPDTDTEGAYALHLDIPCEYAEENLTPILNIYPQSLSCASACEFSPVCRTLKGILRVYARSEPEDFIRANLVLAGGMSASVTEAAEAQSPIELTIPARGWITDADTGGAYQYHTDIADSAITESAVPLLMIPPEYLPAADICGLSRSCQTLSGKLRVYAQKIPETDIPASLTLLDIYSRKETPGSSTGTGSLPIPPATADSLGGVKIGEGLSVTSDGTVSVDAAGLTGITFATDEEVEAALNEAFGS